jgi:hypothetical protein
MAHGRFLNRAQITKILYLIIRGPASVPFLFALAPSIVVLYSFIITNRTKVEARQWP